jgi:uncharacterized membrane protein YqjE
MSDRVVNRSAESRSRGGVDNDDLPSLFGRMGDDLTRLFDLRINLLKVEIREDVDAYIHRGILMAVGAIVVAVGLALTNVAFSFLVATLFSNSQLSQPTRYALGFLITGVVYLLAGGTIVAVTKRRLNAGELLPRRSLAELENDKQLVKTVIQG